MSPGSSDPLADALGALVELMDRANEPSWRDLFGTLRADLRAAVGDDREAVVRRILNLFAGAGSFNDLVLGTMDNFMPAENNELRELKDRVYQAAREAL